MNRRMLIVVVLLVVGIVVGGLAGAEAHEPTPAAASQARFQSIAQQFSTYRDALYGYQVEVPADWSILPASANAVFGVTVFQTYTTAQSELGLIPDDAVKLEVGVSPTWGTWTLSDWTATVRAQVVLDSTFARSADASELDYAQTASRPSAFFETYHVPHPPKSPDDTAPRPIRTIVIDLGPDRVMIARIMPADSPRAAEALNILNSMTDAAVKPLPSAVYATWPSAPDMRGTIEAAAVRESTSVGRNDTRSACPTGVTHPGTEAPNAPLTLQMPFQGGESWTVGGSGAFYGNLYHCNSINNSSSLGSGQYSGDHYATDWNRPGDLNAIVQPVADGTVIHAVVPTCPTTGYGCYVIVDHGSGIRTLYGHLSSVTITSGPVTHTQEIGRVGNSGTTDAHLHLSIFQQHIDGKWYSYCASGCAAGETPQTPQTVKPAPIITEQGATTIEDGETYVSQNGAGDCVTALRDDAQAYGQIPLYFEANDGQTDWQVQYAARAGGYSMFMTYNRIAFNLTLDAPEPKHSGRDPLDPMRLREPVQPARPSRTYGLFLDFVGANASPYISGEDLQEGISSYFKGRPEEWVTGAPHFGKVRYSELYPGIDAVFYGSAKQVQYDFIVAPGADPSLIRLRFDPVESVGLTADGNLRLVLGGRVLTMNAPITYQVIDGTKHAVASRFILNNGDVMFAVDGYDRSLPLIIDPVIVYAGFIGGSGQDDGQGIAVDSGGNAYITGLASGIGGNFPVVAGPDLTINGGDDAYVAKLNSTGTGYLYIGFIGGDGGERGFDVAVDHTGNAYVVGITNSPESSFPVIVGPDTTYNYGPQDAFAAKVNPTGSALVYAGYIGGLGVDHAQTVAVDSSGNAYISGYTESSEASFPVKVGPDLTFNGGSNDAFVAKIDPSGSSIIYAGYVGGNEGNEGEPETVYDSEVDSSGFLYITGGTRSTEASFPVVGGPDSSHNGNSDAFVAKVEASGATLVFSGFIGGGNFDSGSGIALDPDGYVYVVGSAWDGFPVVGGPDLTHSGLADAFITKVNPTGALIRASYFGGTLDDWATDIASDGNGYVYVTGETFSSQDSFPVMGGLGTLRKGPSDPFVAKLDSQTFAPYAPR